MAAGVIALVLEANPELRWRDVQHITIRNAQVRIRLNDPWSIRHDKRQL